MHPLAEQIKNKKERALARAVSIVENDAPDKLELLKDVYPFAGGAHYVGITGSPGAGKSSLVDCLIRELRSRRLLVGVVAVDPTSPFSGGALLGDRVRMADHFTDPGVFIRSMGTRGSLGGLARATKETVRLMDAFGFDVILIETVGVGQSELDVMKTADTTAVVLTPGSGDAVQVFKAGIMEIADLFVINKADLSGVPKLMRELRGLLDLVKSGSDWRPPIVKTISKQNEGIEKLWQEIERHKQFLLDSGEGAERRKYARRQEVLEVVRHQLMKALAEDPGVEEWSRSEDVDPYSAAEEILHEWLPSAGREEKGDEKKRTIHGKG
ncbi:MAG TPA: methylmalonyl Co-A mutase-associated GTPase MeaB [Bacillales bacterium]|nr:methylmalonyl Co-A mutase-associated GTPase MeaB [Bacillales bacterium]